MSTTAPDLLIELDRSRRRGLRSQIEGGLRDAISSGRLAPGASLPSTRALAADLGVTRGVVVAAYDQLLAEGYLLARQGAGTVVNPAPISSDRHVPPADRRAAAVIDFRPSVPELSTFPRAAWLRATRTALQTLPDRYLGYTNPLGLRQLRIAVADYLGRVRGVVAESDQVVICNGFSHGLSLVTRQLLDSGHTMLAVEDPGHDWPRSELAWLGAKHQGVPVDGDGIVVEKLRETAARAALVTPAHQFPTGAVLSPPRRRALIAWARDVDGYVIEDDYDAEYRYDRHPVGAMQGLAPDRVIYCGTLSKSLAPGLRLGWLVLPAPLVGPIARSRMLTDHSTSVPVQAAFAEFLGNGDLDRHLRRMRRVYRERRDVLIAALARWLPAATPSGIAAGLHVLVTLPGGVDEAEVVECAEAAGIRIYPLDEHRIVRSADDPPAILLGYGNLATPAIEEGVRILARVVADCRRRH
jgi:GntR family transcriptional regulator / MocR family aminotransferase